ncbi:MAG: hypothetical protein ACK559_19620, partial [bacterium]
PCAGSATCSPAVRRTGAAARGADGAQAGPGAALGRRGARAGDGPRGAARRDPRPGAWGDAACVAADTLLQPFGAPGPASPGAAPMAGPWPVAAARSRVGAMAARGVGFPVAP